MDIILTLSNEQNYCNQVNHPSITLRGRHMFFNLWTRMISWLDSRLVREINYIKTHKAPLTLQRPIVYVYHHHYVPTPNGAKPLAGTVLATKLVRPVFFQTSTVITYSAVPLWCSQFSHQYCQKTSDSSPVRSRYGVSFVDPASDR